MIHFLQKFAKCGIAGWCLEIIYTSLLALRRRDLTMKGTTSIWMFPIYGCAAFLAPLCRLLQNKPFFIRGLSYMGCIFSAEYLTGTLLQKFNLCPWNYRKSKWNIGQVIRLDYAPFWFLAGLFFEKLALSDKTEASS